MSKRIIFIATLMALIMVLLYFARPPGKPLERGKQHKKAKTAEEPLSVSHGNLPGVTWKDDIHPIFVRNDCGHCHTRGKEVIAEGFEALALGIIDRDDPSNAYYSYHELVYSEGLSQIQEGETLRDGQCCWPRNYPEEKQRRIWVGHPERSVLVRKLEHDYFNWQESPRFFAEALKLKWGPPMPMYRKGKEGHGDHGLERKKMRQFDIRPFYMKIAFNLSLWFGLNRDDLRYWPEKIPATDRMLLRHWISNTVQLIEDGTVIEVEVFNKKGMPLSDAKVVLIGNYNSFERREVNDQLLLATDSSGKVSVSFPRDSIITLMWYVAVEKDGIRSDYQPLRITTGRLNKINITEGGR